MTGYLLPGKMTASVPRDGGGFVIDPGNQAAVETYRSDPRRGKGVVPQDDGVVVLRLGQLSRLGDFAAVGKGEMVKDLHGIDPRRNVQHMGLGIFRQFLVAQESMGAVNGAIKEPVMTGEAELAIRPDPARGGGGIMRMHQPIDRAVIFGQKKAEMKIPVRRTPGDGGQRIHLVLEMGHHVEMVDVPGDEGRIGLDVDDGHVFAGMMLEGLFPVPFQRMRNIRPHLIF